MQSAAQLLKQKEKALKGMYIRSNHHKGPKIIVNMGTCGIAAGAREVLSAIVAEIDKHNLQVQVSLEGCAGDCFAEPMFEVHLPGKEKASHVKMTPEQAAGVVREMLS